MKNPPHSIAVVVDQYYACAHYVQLHMFINMENIYRATTSNNRRRQVAPCLLGNAVVAFYKTQKIQIKNKKKKQPNKHNHCGNPHDLPQFVDDHNTPHSHIPFIFP